MTADDRVPVSLDRRRFVLGTAAVLLGATATTPLLSACGSEEAASLPDPSEITVGLANTIQGLDPHTADTIGSISVVHYLFEGLYGLERGNMNKLVPQLAVGPPEQIDPTTYHVRIRPGATFHDGRPVKASDVAYSINRVLDPATSSLLAVFLTAFDKAAAVDGQVLRIKLKKPWTLLTERLALVKVMAEHTAADATAEELARKPIGTGPYRLDAFSADNKQVTLTKYARYNGPLQANVPQIKCSVILDDTARLAALQSQQVTAMNDIAYQDVRSADSSGVTTGTVPSFNQSLIIFNTSRPTFADKRTRQAFLYSVDRESITQSVFFGKARPAVSYLPEDHPMFRRPKTEYRFDVDKAKSLLGSTGEARPSFTLLVSNLGWLSAQIPLLQASLQQAGFDVKIEQGETESLVPRVFAGDFDAWLTVTDPSIFGGYDADMLIRWSYTGAIPESMARWTNAAAGSVSQLLDQATATEQAADQADLYGQVQQIIADEAPIFPLHHRDITAAWLDGLENFAPTVPQGVDLLGVRI
ncbi:ABC transporter substrate-binding protein [Qaidamihabitans albus]|uniref:ABC transporter substrate-binding protein n=1 Tax=Qaidamihabitans albus TaxID=2795733 RepID=UPI0018F2624B|nr:ABC transporter substrate-binding protein [Qaidamihabitans albus]